MKIFIANPIDDHTIYIEEILYTLNQDGNYSFLVISLQRRLSFRTNEIIIGFILNSNIYQDDYVEITIKANYLPKINSTNSRILLDKKQQLKDIKKTNLIQDAPDDQDDLDYGK